MQAPLAVLRTWVERAWAERHGPAALDEAANAAELACGQALQAGLEMASHGIVVLDAEWNILSLNRHALALLPPPGGPSVDAFWARLPAPVTELQRPLAEQALQAAAAHSFVTTLSREDVWIEFTFNQHAMGSVVHLHDVSAERQAQALLQDSEACRHSLFDGNTQPMWVFDVETRRVLAVNQAAAAFYGLPADGGVLPLVDALFREGDAAPWLAGLPARDYQQQMQVCAQRRMSGELVLVELACSTVRWLARPAVLVSVVDVAARHFADGQLQRLNDRLEAQIAQCNAELQGNRQELDTFTRALSDELKEPLHGISGFASTLADRYAAVLDPPARHYLARIRASALQLARLFDDLRTLACLPGVTLRPGPVDLAPACQRMAAEWRKREPGRQLALDVPPTLPVFGDRDLLVTAINSLLDNAWKFTANRAQGWVKVALVAGPLPGTTVLMVADNGVGFNAAYADQLFTPFQRLHSSADYPGGGLGLAIVKRVAERHGGAAWASTTAQGGASFFLSLPQAPTGGAALPEPVRAPDQAG